MSVAELRQLELHGVTKALPCTAGFAPCNWTVTSCHATQLRCHAFRASIGTWSFQDSCGFVPY